MNCRSILAAALIALVAGPESRAQDRQESMAEKLLERLDQMAKRLADEDLRAEIREEFQDLVEMMRAQLARGQSQLGVAADSYRKAMSLARQGVEKIDLSAAKEGRVQALLSLQGIQLGNLEGLRKLNLENLKGLDALQGLKLDLENLKGLDTLQGLKLNLENLRGLEVLQKLDMSKLQGQLGQANVYLQKAGEGMALRNLLTRVREQDPGDAAKNTLEQVREILEKSLKAVPDVNTKEIIQKVMESLKKSSQGATGTGESSDYSTARNLYRYYVERQDPRRAFDFSEFERFQERQGEWQKYASEATKEWQKYTEQARKEWETYLKASRKDLEKQMEQALEKYRKALEQKKDPGEGGLSFTWGVTAPEGRGSFRVTPPGIWSYSTEGDLNFAWGKVGEDGELFFDKVDGKDTPFFVGDRDRWFWGTVEKEGEKKEDKEKPDKQGSTPFLKLFKKQIGDKGSDQDVDVEIDEFLEIALSQELAETEFIADLALIDVIKDSQDLQVIPDVEMKLLLEEAVIELKLEPEFEFLFDEPVLELKLAPELGREMERSDPQEQIRELVNELRKEMREIRQLVQKLRKKAKEQSPH